MSDLLNQFFTTDQLPKSFGGMVFAAYMAFAFFKGVTRQIVGLLCLLVGFAAGYLAFRHSPEYLSKVFNPLSPTIVIICSIVAGGVAHQASRAFVRKAFSDGSPPGTTGERVRSSFSSLIPAAGVLWILGMAVRWVGAVSMMQFVDEGIKAETPRLDAKYPWFSQMQRALGEGQIGVILDRTDPLSSTESSALCSLLLLRRDEESWGRLRQDYQAGPILNHPSLKRLMNDKDWLRTASYANYARLMTLPEVSAALQDATLVERLRAINVERAAREAIGAVPAQ